MSFIFVFGPCWNNLETLKSTISNNTSIIPNIKSIYVATNDSNVYNYFDELKDSKIKCIKFAENEGHQTACFNAIISGMKMVIDYDNDDDDDIVIFSHEDVYVKDLSLFNNSVSKFNKGVDIVCRIYEGTKKGEPLNYYMNDAFFIKKNKVKEIFNDSKMMTIHPGMFCEGEFTKIIKQHKVFAIPYYSHSTHKDSELGFYHILNYGIGDIPFWDKSNIEEIYNM
jgi:hypothetical protein